MKVLIVDDDPWSRRLYAHLLRRLHCEPIEVEGGSEALACLARERPALALLDVEMPGLDGSAVLRAIRASPELSKLPVVVVTATTQRARVLELIELGVAGYLVKQSGVEETLRRLERVIATIRASTADPSSPLADEAETPASRARRVLIADPDASYRALVRLALESSFTVAEARTGPEALRSFRSAPTDLVVIGEGLDLLGGERLAAGIRAGGEWTRIVLARDGAPSDAHASSFDAVVTRSFVPANVVAALDALVPA